ncbi:serine hydrolase domain-containing protein [Actinomadura sp. LOL_016]|uniref:serine hydrolase domain-containing protein n=1 Tax=unclassified Actinomadura TaxID=2626254 RepID=UPI003A7F7028
MNDIFPTKTIHAGSNAPTSMPDAPTPTPDEIKGLTVDTIPAQLDLGRRPPRVSDIIDKTDTDAWMVLHDNKVVVEEYPATGMGPTTRHLLMSVSKSVAGIIAGALVDQQKLDPAELVTHYVPELAEVGIPGSHGRGYVGATVRNVLDMRSAIEFSEAYKIRRSEVRILEAAAGWGPPDPDHPNDPKTIKECLCTFERDTTRQHGGDFKYRSCETTVLGWVCENASNKPYEDPYASLVSELLWVPMGAEHDAYMTVDSVGTGMFDGSICATLRDMARFGALICADGESLSGQRVVSKEWVKDILTGDPDSAKAFKGSATPTPMPGGMFRNMFWFPGSNRNVVLCIGVHGQMIYMNRATNTVGVKFSNWKEPEPEEGQPGVWKGLSALLMFEKINDHLAGR